MKKLQSLANATIVTNARTTEITGDGQKVNGIAFADRVSNAVTHVELAGVFVQIGLVPNTEFMKGAIELNRFGEIIVDEKGATNVPGIFRRGRRDDGALQADRDRRGRRGEGGAVGVRPPDPDVSFW